MDDLETAILKERAEEMHKDVREELPKLVVLSSAAGVSLGLLMGSFFLYNKSSNHGIDVVTAMIASGIATTGLFYGTSSCISYIKNRLKDYVRKSESPITEIQKETYQELSSIVDIRFHP